MNRCESQPFRAAIFQPNPAAVAVRAVLGCHITAVFGYTVRGCFWLVPASGTTWHSRWHTFWHNLAQVDQPEWAPSCSAGRSGGRPVPGTTLDWLNQLPPRLPALARPPETSCSHLTMRRSVPGPLALLLLLSVCAAISCWALSCLASPSEQADQEEAIRAIVAGAPGERSQATVAEVAAAIVAATDRPNERAWLLGVGRLESDWSEAVCRGDRHGDKGRAHGCWQSWDPDRSGGIAGDAARAVRRLRLARGECRAHGLSGMVSNYATGRTCQWDGAGPYVEAIRSAATRLW